MEKKKLFEWVSVESGELPREGEPLCSIKKSIVVVGKRIDGFTCNSEYHFDRKKWNVLGFDSNMLITHWLKEVEVYVLSEQEAKAYQRSGANRTNANEYGQTMQNNNGSLIDQT